MKPCILAATPENAIILDPFSGGNTTRIAAEIVGNCKYIGIDLEQEYLDLTIKRYEELRENNDLSHLLD